MHERLQQIRQAVERSFARRHYPAPGPGFDDASLRDFSRDVVEAHAADDRLIDPPHRAAWDALLRDAQRMVAALRPLIEIRHVAHDAYTGPDDMREDVLRNRRLDVSTLHCDHPLWSPEQNCAFRVAHDILGHVLHPHPFSLVGEYLAFHEHMRRTDPDAKQALFTEVCVYASIRYTVGEYPQTQRAIAYPAQLLTYERRFLA